jgi:hypothetical protein
VFWLDGGVVMGRSVTEIVWVILGAITLLLTVVSIYGLCTLSPEPQDFQTFKRMEHMPLTPLLLAGATHMVLALFAKQQLSLLKVSNRAPPGPKTPPAPILFPFFCGKFFMCFRLMMAYSSGNLGVSINFFLFQELLLIVMHTVLSWWFLSKISTDPRKRQDMFQAMLYVILIDTCKTVATGIYFCFFRPGLIAGIFNRLPSVSIQICASLLIHLILDVVQSVSSVFTMYISTFFQGKKRRHYWIELDRGGSVTHQDAPTDWPFLHKFSKWSVAVLDMYWIEKLFTDESQPEVSQRAKEVIEIVKQRYN